MLRVLINNVIFSFRSSFLYFIMIILVKICVVLYIHNFETNTHIFHIPYNKLKTAFYSAPRSI
jgi:hypothetical protein